MRSAFSFSQSLQKIALIAFSVLFSISPLSPCNFSGGVKFSDLTEKEGKFPKKSFLVYVGKKEKTFASKSPDNPKQLIGKTIRYSHID